MYVEFFTFCINSLIFRVKVDDDDFIRSKRRREHNAVFVIVLFNACGNDTGNPDAVTAHDDGVFFTVFVKIHSMHGFAVFCAEFEYMPDFNAFFQLKRFAAVRADIAGFGVSDVGIPGDFAISLQG